MEFSIYHDGKHSSFQTEEVSSVPYFDLDQWVDSGNSSVLETRADVKWLDVCNSISLGVSAVSSVANNVPGWKNMIDTIFRRNRTSQECEVISRNIGKETIMYYPRGSCNFDMQRKTMESAISQGVNALSSVKASKGCIIMDHGGDWKGYIKIATEGEDINSVTCEETDWEICAKGTGGSNLLD